MRPWVSMTKGPSDRSTWRARAARPGTAAPRWRVGRAALDSGEAVVSPAYWLAVQRRKKGGALPICVRASGQVRLPAHQLFTQWGGVRDVLDFGCQGVPDCAMAAPLFHLPPGGQLTGDRVVSGVHSSAVIPWARRRKAGDSSRTLRVAQDSTVQPRK